MEKIKVRITTKSNLFIGGMPKIFEIGGVDMETITDYKGRPIIPASSLKGVLRRITKEIEGEEEIVHAITEAYRTYLRGLQEENKELLASGQMKLEQERLDAIKNRFQEKIDDASVEYLFGIQGFNDTPKLIFQDLKLDKEVLDWYSIDSKNTIETFGQEIKANPRTYKTVRPNLTFCGEIILHRMDKLQVNGVAEFIEHALLKFNDGIYRMGNSGSRGYGLIEVHTGKE